MADVDKNIDAPPAKQEESEEIYEEQGWKEYFKPANVSKLIHRNFALFTSLVSVYYLIHFVMCAGAVDAYSDITRQNPCTVGMSVD